MALIKKDVKFKANEEVDVLDEKECFIRGKVVKVEGSAATVSYKQENRSYNKDNVFKCGEKLPFVPCENPTTTPIKIKFVPKGSLEELKKKNIGQYLYDAGEPFKKHGLFSFGFDKQATMEKLDDLTNEQDKQKLI